MANRITKQVRISEKWHQWLLKETRFGKFTMSKMLDFAMESFSKEYEREIAEDMALYSRLWPDEAEDENEQNEAYTRT